ncbi:major facilitator superfamily domain-containing protein [Tricladium varicosporioides]|nr:major facilitator superfamily domain-containing protein [Hymenoscyphus varicosporioides]
MPTAMDPEDPVDTESEGSQDGARFPKEQLFFLALCRIAEPVALTSVFPYAYDMMKHFGGSVGENAGLYAGIVEASFSFAETITAFMWGALSDHIGRKPVLLIGCFGTMLSMLVIGFSTNIYLAVLGRAFGGGLNGNIGIVQTMVGELVTNPKHEPRAYSIMPFFFTIGCTVGPAVGGYFSRPAEAFPNVFGKVPLFIDFPYLLPNLICVAMLLVTIVIATVFLEETHPEILEKRRARQVQAALFIDAEVPLLSGTYEECSYGTDSTVTVLGSPASSISKGMSIEGDEKLTFRIWNPIIAVCILCCHTLTYIQLLPIFLQTKYDTSVPKYYFGGVGGLAYPLYKTGQVMGIGGLISLGVQSLLFPPCTEHFGAVPTYTAVTLLHPLAYFTISYIAFLPHGIWQNVALYSWMTVRTIFSVFPYPLLLIFVKRATPRNSMLGRVNGIVSSSGAAFRAIAPTISGELQTIGEKNHLSALPWWGSGCLAIVGALQVWSIAKQFRER